MLKEIQKRAVELEIAKSEIDILYRLSSHLIESSTPQAVLDGISVYARDNGATSGYLYYVDENDNRWMELVAEWALIEAQRLEIGFRLPIPDHSIRERWQSEPDLPTLIADVTTTEVISSDNQDMIQRFGVRAFVALPLHSKGRWIGVIYFCWDSPHEFDVRDERIFTALQRQASPVIDSIRLLDQSRKRSIELEQTNQELNLLYHASEVINKATSYHEIVDAVAYFDGEADVVTLMLWEAFDWETANYLEVVVVFDRNGDAKLQSGVRLPKEDFPIAKHMLGERVWLFEDALTDPRMDSVTANNWAMLGIRSFMGPALYHGNRWIGGITFHSSHPRHYTQREVRLFAAIGDLVVAAIERIRLQQETEAARQAAERFAEQAQQLAAFQERNRLARELHDSVSQVLYSISLWGHSTRAFLKYDPSRISESVDHILSLTEVGLSEMRALIFELRPESLEEEGIISALSKQAESLQAHHGVQITTEFCDEPHLILQKKSDLYWIAREALHNAIKHAQATHITLSLLEIEAGYCLEISDNGLGFDTSQSFPGHLGFTSMQERTAVIKGSMNIKSTLGVGTQITLTLHS